MIWTLSHLHTLTHPCLSQLKLFEVPQGMLFYFIMPQPGQETHLPTFGNFIFIFQDPSQAPFSRNFPLPCALRQDATPSSTSFLALTPSSAPATLLCRGLCPCLSPQYIPIFLKSEMGSYLICTSKWLAFNQNANNTWFVELIYNWLN